MPDPDPILSLDHVSVEDAADYDVDLLNVSLTLNAGDLALVLLERPNFHTPLADTAGGLVRPDEGKVLFLGRDFYRLLLPSRAAALRGQIGRVFDGRAWVSNLDVDENVLLPHLHLGSR